MIDLAEVLSRFERTAVDTALCLCAGNITRAAALLSISRTTMVEKMRKFRLVASSYRGEEKMPVPKEVERGSRLYLVALETIFEALRANQWNRSAAAKELGLSLRCVRYKAQILRSLGWEVPDNPRQRRQKIGVDDGNDRSIPS